VPGSAINLRISPDGRKISMTNNIAFYRELWLLENFVPAGK
jgi:hypothetical protein